jgi:hypothetical protein
VPDDACDALPLGERLNYEVKDDEDGVCGVAPAGQVEQSEGGEGGGRVEERRGDRLADPESAGGRANVPEEKRCVRRDCADEQGDAEALLER